MSESKVVKLFLVTRPGGGEPKLCIERVGVGAMTALESPQWSWDRKMMLEAGYTIESVDYVPLAAVEQERAAKDAEIDGVKKDWSELAAEVSSQHEEITALRAAAKEREEMWRELVRLYRRGPEYDDYAGAWGRKCNELRARLGLEQEG